MKQGWCMQSNFPASFWSQEGIFLALLSGAGAFHRLVQEGGHWQGNFEVHTLAPSSFMDWHCHSHPGAYQGGLGLMEGSGHAAFGTWPVKVLWWPWPHSFIITGKEWRKLGWSLFTIHYFFSFGFLSIPCHTEYSNFYEDTNWYEHIRKSTRILIRRRKHF